MTIQHGPTYIYNGPGSWPLSVESTQNMVESYIDSREIHYIDSLIDITRSTKLVIIPGGNSPSMVTHMNCTKNPIPEYVKNGGRYLGICAGAILATEKTAIKPPGINWLHNNGSSEALDENNTIALLQKEGKVYKTLYNPSPVCPQNSPLYSGTCVVPHIVKNGTSSDDPLNFCTVSVRCPLRDINNTFKTFHYSGPCFPNPEPYAKILLEYTEPLEIPQVEITTKGMSKGVRYQFTGKNISDPHPAAALSFSYEKGQVVLTAIHPEIDPTTFSQMAQKHEFRGTIQEELMENDTTHRQQFIKTIFTELQLN